MAPSAYTSACTLPLALLLAMLPLAGCASLPTGCGRGCVSEKVAARMGVPLGPAPACGQTFWPNGADLQDGLSEDEAVLIALWNNAAFQELLADLGIARGDLVQAGLLPNPEVAYFFSAPHKPFKYAIDLPLEAFWLRPVRVAAARSESQRVCLRLTQSALDLIRDVRQGYADVLLAEGRLRVAEEAVRIRGQVHSLADARLQAGDISPQEAAAARIDALAAEQERVRTGYDVSLAKERLSNLLGIPQHTGTWELAPESPPRHADLDVELLTDEAVQSRPDALAAAENAAAAAERLRLARWSWGRLLGTLDATSGRRTGHEFGPAFRLTVPIFNRNEGAVARAEAELQKAERQRRTIHNQIVLDVHQAHFRYAQAQAELAVLEKQVQPEVNAAIRRSEAAYREGNTPYVVVLESTRQLLDSQLRHVQLTTELRRAWAELERSVGRKLEPDAEAEAPMPETLDMPPAANLPPEASAPVSLAPAPRLRQPLEKESGQ